MSLFCSFRSYSSEILSKLIIIIASLVASWSGYKVSVLHFIFYWIWWIMFVAIAILGV